MNTYKVLLTENKRWVEEKPSTNFDFNEQLLPGQKPLMCSDSRVPFKGILTTTAGYISMHRDPATMVDHSDMNLTFKLSEKQIRG